MNPRAHTITSHRNILILAHGKSTFQALNALTIGMACSDVNVHGLYPIAVPGRHAGEGPASDVYRPRRLVSYGVTLGAGRGGVGWGSGLVGPAGNDP